MRSWFLLLCFLAITAHAEVPNVAAAADLKFALGEIAAAYQKETGRAVRLSFGSSGNFARQIPQGAPFELFLSADEDYILKLAAEGLLQGDGHLYAIGRIALLVPHGSTLTADGELKDLQAAVSDGRIRRFAIANPEHAPYGRAARAALQRAGVWESLQGKLVLGERRTGRAVRYQRLRAGRHCRLVSGQVAGNCQARHGGVDSRELAPAATPAHGADA
jgi:molybdate transport system substrate-binding protein